MEISVYSSHFEWLAQTRLAQNVQLQRELYGIGGFQILVSVDDPAAEALAVVDNIVRIDGDPRKSGIVRGFSLTETRSGRFLEIFGITGDGLLSRRICVPPTEAQVPGSLGWDRTSGPAETVLKHYVRRNMTSPFDANRKIPNLQIAPDLGRGKSVPAQLRFTPLDEDIGKIAALAEIGFEIYADIPGKRWVFDVIPGVDRTTSQTSVDPVTLSIAFQNLSGYKYAEDYQNYRNCGYAGGAGTDENRLIYALGAENTGLNRWETFLDCGSVNTLNDLMYYGNLKLSEFLESKTLEADALGRVFHFGGDYNIGDRLTVLVKRLNLSLESRVEGVDEVWGRQEGYAAKIRLGKKITNILTMLKQRNEVN
jgi:hypothetical protein